VGESFSSDSINGPLSAGAIPSTFNPFSRSSPTRPRRLRSVSTPRAGSHFPPAPATAILPRSSSDITGSARPVPFSSKVASRVNPAATGVSVLEHMERLDRVEEGLKRLGRGEDEDEEDEVLFEEDEDAERTPLMKEPVTAPAVKPTVPPSQPSASTSTAGSTLVNGDAEGATAGAKPRLSGLGAAAANRPSLRMSEDSGSKPMHVRWASHGGHEGRSGRSMDVSRTPLPMDGTSSGTKTVIAEVSVLRLIVGR
jgi:phosphatidylinositol 4-kinase type 2